MNEALKSAMMNLMPLHRWATHGKIRDAEEAIRLVGNRPSYADMIRMAGEHKAPPAYGYDADATSRRGKYRAKQMMKLLDGKDSCRVLELGCWDGMVEYWLQHYNINAFGLDNRDEGFDDKAKRCVYVRDAHDLDWLDSCFPLVFSYDCMEHFADPAKVLSEAYRVTKPGGLIYLMFGPLYNSPFGLHAYREIPIPYCQHLFAREMLYDYMIDYEQLNTWTLSMFRTLLFGCGKVLKYKEYPDARYVSLISQYPSCFPIRNIDEYLVSHIEVLIRKD